MPWQVQEAKQRLSELLRAAQGGEPQVITKHGEDVAVVIDIVSYRRLAGVQLELADYLRHGPTLDDLDLHRPDDRPREADVASVTDR